MTDAFFVPDGDDRYIATEWTRGPWSPEAQHGGPPAALLGRAIENIDDEPFRVARIVLDILKPVPLGPLSTSVTVLRPGRNVQLVEASLRSIDDEVMRASAWRIRTESLELDRVTSDVAPRLPKSDGEPELFPMTTDRNYLAAMEWRFESGGFLEPGPAVAWLRMRVPLVEGEAPSPLSRVLAAVDSASGISGELDFAKWLYINPDLVVHLHRNPVGEWVRLDARTDLSDDGIGVAASVISDRRGRIGHSAQSLLVRRHRAT